jgi:hypothetical protein
VQVARVGVQRLHLLHRGRYDGRVTVTDLIGRGRSAEEALHVAWRAGRRTWQTLLTQSRYSCPSESYRCCAEPRTTWMGCLLSDPPGTNMAGSQTSERRSRLALRSGETREVTYSSAPHWLG